MVGEQSKIMAKSLIQVWLNRKTSRWEVWKDSGALPVFTQPSKHKALLHAFHLLDAGRNARMVIYDEQDQPSATLRLQLCRRVQRRE
jgi:hypothetical protein